MPTYGICERMRAEGTGHRPPEPLRRVMLLSTGGEFGTSASFLVEWASGFRGARVRPA